MVKAEPLGGQRRSTWRTDLWLVGAASIAAYFIAGALELQETLSHGLARFERWQADEIPLTLIVLAAGLAWYAFRRRHESQAQLALREQAEARVAKLLAHNRELAQQLISLQESERLAIARELHDEFAQRCSAIRIEAAFLRHCDANDHAAMLACADRADVAAQALYQLVHDMLRRLRPADLDTLGLSAALQALCKSWQDRSGTSCSFTQQGADDALAPPLSDAVNITVYRVAQEALTNVTRHAAARHVQVALSLAAPGELGLTIQDDGRGMNAGVAHRGLGLLGAVERAAAVGGELQVHSAPDAGVRLALRIPLTPVAASKAAA